MIIENGKQVALEFTVAHEGTVVESNPADQPLVYTHGEGQLFPELEKALEGRREFDAIELELPPEASVGPVREDGFMTVELEIIPEEYRQTGAIFGFQDPDGTARQVKLHDIQGNQAVLDFNHPLAGCTLLVKAKILSIN